MKLIKDNQHFVLVDDNRLVIGATDPQLVEHGKREKLSLVNCRLIEFDCDLEKLSEEEYEPNYNNQGEDSAYFERLSFKQGFIKALKILKDKRFTEDDMLQMAGFSFSVGRSNIFTVKEAEQDAINYLPQIQPIEWEVEFVINICGAKVYEVPEIARDENGCVILKRKEWQK